MFNKETLTPVKQVAKHLETQDSYSCAQVIMNYTRS